MAPETPLQEGAASQPAVPSAAIVIPTRGRPASLRVALTRVAEQARAAGVEVLVVDDAPAGDPAARAIAQAAGARVVPGPRPSRGINGARNAGVAATDADLLVFLDDDVEVHDGWLAALLRAAAALGDEVGFLTGPVHARFEDHPLRSCGRERPPITTLHLGDADVDAPHAWGVNMAVRRSALALAGPFDERLVDGGDEEELQQRWRALRPGGRIRYVAAAAVDHRRAGPDARLRALARAQRARGQAARRFDVSRGTAPALRRELRPLVGSLLHVVRFACPNGLTMAAHALGRLDEAWAPTPPPATPGVDDFLSGASGTVGGLRGRLAGLRDRWLDLRGAPARRRAAARPIPRRRVLVVGVDRPGVPGTMAASRAELESARHHDVVVRTAAAGTRGKFENLNALLAEAPLASVDWVLVVDDDVDLPRGFLDAFLATAEAAGLRLAQPAHRLRSHAAWPVTRRSGRSWRETSFVEIGPVTAFHRDTFGTLLPFPELRMGWGLDARWSAVARERGWRMGVVDLTPVGHVLRPVAATYPRADALAEAQAFLRGRAYVRRDEVGELTGGPRR